MAEGGDGGAEEEVMWAERGRRRDLVEFIWGIELVGDLVGEL